MQVMAITMARQFDRARPLAFLTSMFYPPRENALLLKQTARVASVCVP
jgi:hypothetical protein